MAQIGALVKGADLVVNHFAELMRLADMHKQLTSLAQVTAGLLEDENLEAMDDAWTKRSRLLRNIDVLHKRLLPLFGQWANELESMGSQRGIQAQKAVDLIRKRAKKPWRWMLSLPSCWGK